jgi:Trypsin-like peptidase domain
LSDNTPLFLETFIVPVCRFEMDSNRVLIRRYHGTAFFVNNDGVFVTAKHVIERGREDVTEKGGFLGLCPRPKDGPGNVASYISSYDHADPPYDVCVGRCNGTFPTFITLRGSDVATWSDVVTYGYPETALNVSLEGFWIYGRGFKGYIHRLVKSGQFASGSHPDAFEVSFAMHPGLSGAPLFLPDRKKWVAVAVCVGANRAEVLDFEYEEIQESGEVHRERRLRVEEYGIAHDLRPLLDWRPSVLRGLTLAEASAVG